MKITDNITTTMKNAINITLTNGELEVAAKIIGTISECMSLDKQDMVWRVYKSVILELSGREMCDLQDLASKL